LSLTTRCQASLPDKTNRFNLLNLASPPANRWFSRFEKREEHFAAPNSRPGLYLRLHHHGMDRSRRHDLFPLVWRQSGNSRAMRPLFGLRRKNNLHQPRTKQSASRVARQRSKRGSSPFTARRSNTRSPPRRVQPRPCQDPSGSPAEGLALVQHLRREFRSIAHSISLSYNAIQLDIIDKRVQLPQTL
jgi:hypothetical protein